MPTGYIGMGGNLPSQAGPPEATLAAAVGRLGLLGHISACSSLYSTEPVGYADQPRFVNAAVALETDLPARELLDHLLRIEREFGRDRSAGIRNGPRTLDLDLLLFGDQAIHEPDLVVPHPRLAERAFVLVPLSEIASNQVDVTRHMRVGQLLEALQQASPTQVNAIIPIQSVLWHAGVVSDQPASLRPDLPDPHR